MLFAVYIQLESKFFTGIQIFSVNIYTKVCPCAMGTHIPETEILDFL